MIEQRDTSSATLYELCAIFEAGSKMHGMPLPLISSSGGVDKSAALPGSFWLTGP